MCLARKTEVMSTLWQRLARAGVGEDYAHVYAERFRRLAADGVDVHGEAALLTELVPASGRVLDAGCGTGRVGVRLAELGYDVVGCDADPAMVEVARQEAPDLDWRVADLADLVDCDLGDRFDAVILAGNIFPLLEPGTLPDVAASLAAHVRADGLVVAGFGLNADNLPPGVPLIPLSDVDNALAQAGLVLRDRWATWDRRPFGDVGEAGYAVSTWVPA